MPKISGIFDHYCIQFLYFSKPDVEGSTPFARSERITDVPGKPGAQRGGEPLRRGSGHGGGIEVHSTNRLLRSGNSTIQSIESG
jgi:hypothetical protein